MEKEREAAYGKYPRKLRRTVERETITTSDVRETERLHERKKERENTLRRGG